MNRTIRAAVSVRRFHRAIGIVMLLPFVGWAATGFIFFIKPGYGGAYESLPLPTYALEHPLAISPRPDWREVRMLKTILGPHLLVRTAGGWMHLDTHTLEPAAAPSEAQVHALVSDAIASRRERYGTIDRLTGNVALTTTGARVTLDWKTLTLQQRGRDTDRIDALYRLHYLQWTGVPMIDKVLGFAGLTSLLALTTFGATLAFRR
jgi:hypothetical protein